MKTHLNFLLESMQRSAVAALCVLLFMASGCGKQDPPDEEEICKDELYFYIDYDNKKQFWGDQLLNDRLLVGLDWRVTRAEIVAYIDQTGLFKPVDANDFWSFFTAGGPIYTFVFVVLREPRSCSSLKEIIQTLEKSPLVDFANLTFHGEKFTLNTNIVRDGYLRVGSFSSSFTVKVKDTKDLSDLYALARETNTEIMGQATRYHGGWFVIRADENSKGNAMQMANYFHESGKFLFADVDIIYHDLIINP